MDQESVKKFEKLVASLLKSHWQHEANMQQTYYTSLVMQDVANTNDEENKVCEIWGDNRFEFFFLKDF